MTWLYVLLGAGAVCAVALITGMALRRLNGQTPVDLYDEDATAEDEADAFTVDDDEDGVDQADGEDQELLRSMRRHPSLHIPSTRPTPAPGRGREQEWGEAWLPGQRAAKHWRG
ncbi:hypothetical protein [Streptomyces sp. NBC_00198]|uniref:hypothetical protein n=1 Tax=Streptomyces sp. NBC_00198 TaxID=2975677 RepID=UPI002258013B|nr:hypothetical protein [Streptomyces sp. NBC_00198]MCX5285978.1 hypothetical protein [Streptomyces sp. NBC_00198]MCX5286287.1 hypothetical protein [Streptomyces sp. NBC_00198]